MLLRAPRDAAHTATDAATFRGLVDLLRHRRYALLVSRDHGRPRRTTAASSPKDADDDKDCHRQQKANGDATVTKKKDTEAAAVGPTAYFVVAAVGAHLPDALVAKGYAGDDLQLPVAPDDAVRCEPGSARSLAAEAEINSALEALESADRLTPHDLLCQWFDA